LLQARSVAEAAYAGTKGYFALGHTVNSSFIDTFSDFYKHTERVCAFIQRAAIAAITEDEKIVIKDKGERKKAERLFLS
jgi:hypothetical protein